MKSQSMKRLFDFLDKCEKLKLPYNLNRSRENAIEVQVRSAPCEYWEVEFFIDGHMEAQVSWDLENIYYDKEALQFLKKEMDALEVEE